MNDRTIHVGTDEQWELNLLLVTVTDCVNWLCFKFVLVDLLLVFVRRQHCYTCSYGECCNYISRESKTTRNVLWSRASVCVCLCVCLSTAACLQYCTEPDVTWGSGRGCPLVVHYWADLQSVHGLCCYGNIMEMCGRAQRRGNPPG